MASGSRHLHGAERDDAINILRCGLTTIIMGFMPFERHAVRVKGIAHSIVVGKLLTVAPVVSGYRARLKDESDGRL